VAGATREPHVHARADGDAGAPAGQHRCVPGHAGVQRARGVDHGNRDDEIEEDERDACAEEQRAERGLTGDVADAGAQPACSQAWWPVMYSSRHAWR